MAAVAALADHTHEAGRLNAKRHAKLVAHVQELTEGFTEAMTSPRRVTWPRLYGNLLRADGVDVADAQAVGGWLEAFTARPYAERQAALGFTADAAAGGPLAEAGWLQALAGERSRQARLLLARRLQSVALGEQVRPQPGRSPLIPGAPQGEPDILQEADAWYDAQAGELSDRWTAAGLDALLRGPYAHLAPGGRGPAPLLGIVGALADQHLETFGPQSPPLPPPPLPACPEGQAAAFRTAPLPRALARAATDPETADAQLRELALATDFLAEDEDGVLTEGRALAAWRHGGPAELTGLALDLFSALLAELAQDEETEEEFPGEHLGTLYFLYQRAGAPQSVARQAAQEELWIVPSWHETEPDASVPATGPYELPGPQALSTVTGIPALAEADRDDLQPAAARLARLVDRLAALGITKRIGDALTLTPQGSALLRDALLLGTGRPGR